MYAFPLASTVMPYAISALLPPRYVEYTILPDGSNFVTNASGTKQPVKIEQSLPGLPACLSCKAPAVTGKSGETVSPVTYTLPCESTAIAWTTSLLPPPRYVELVRMLRTPCGRLAV